jgi:L-alanine-DL-glutamate epimerase-like enolase superfamily enzyme
MAQIDNEIFDITAIRIRVLDPVKNIVPFQDATMGPFHTFGMAIITLEDAYGNIGEAPVFSTYINVLETCLFPILLHSPNILYKNLFSTLYWSIRNEGFRGQAAALLGQIDLALHDLASRRSGVPLHQYLGAKKNSVKVYGSGGGTNYTCKELEQEVCFFLDRGVEYYKMKVGKNFGKQIDEDVERVKFVRRIIGDECKLAIDANQIWTCEQAMTFIDKAGIENIAWLEEPVHSAAYDQIQKLCAHVPVPVSYGESERSGKTFPILSELGVKHFQPVPTQMSGIKEWSDVRDLAAEKGLMFSSGGYSFFTAFLLATANEKAMLENLRCIMKGLEEYLLVMPEWEKGGCMKLPDIEGIPVRIDWEYCTKKNKIIKCFSWSRHTVKPYSAFVTL